MKWQTLIANVQIASVGTTTPGETRLAVAGWGRAAVAGWGRTATSNS